METIEIKYFFSSKNEFKTSFNISIDPKTIQLCNHQTEPLPSWTILQSHQCPICPIQSKATTYCPLSVNLVKIVSDFQDLISHDRINVEVITPERKFTKETSAQEGISSLMGLYIAISACPLTDFFKPMARFHLPFANEEETIIRAVSTYLLANYFVKGHKGSLDLNKLTKIYNNIQTVNIHIAHRLRMACKKDSTINAVILLDLFAKAMPPAIEESLEKFRHLYAPFFNNIF